MKDPNFSSIPSKETSRTKKLIKFPMTETNINFVFAI